MQQWHRSHVGDHSAYHYHSLLLGRLQTTAAGLTADQLRTELQQAQDLLQDYPLHEALWHYAKFLSWFVRQRCPASHHSLLQQFEQALERLLQLPAAEIARLAAPPRCTPPPPSETETLQRLYRSWRRVVERTAPASNAQPLQQ